MSALGIYTYLFFLLYGPKLFGVIDTSIIANFLMLFFLTNYNVKINEAVSKLIMGICFLIMCYLGVAIYYESFDVVYVGRLVRSFFSLFCVYAFCVFFQYKPFDEKINWLINLLLLHAVLVICSATFFTSLQEYMRCFNDFGAHVRQFRSTGMMAGFDISGILCNVGVVLVLTQNKFCILKYLIFIIAVVFTSRFSIVSLSIILLTNFLLFYKKNNRTKKFFIIFPLIVVAMMSFFLIAMTTYSIISNEYVSFIGVSDNVLDKLKYTYAHRDIYDVEEQHFIFPNTFPSLIFGEGFYGGGDPGYVRIINCVGLSGMITIIFWHLYLFSYVMNVNSSNVINDKKKYFIVFFFAFVIVILDLKNSYFFTGTFFEMMLFVFFSITISLHGDKHGVKFNAKGEFV